MVSAPYLLQLHPDFLGAAPVPVPGGPSLSLRAADGGFTRSHRHLLSLPKAPRFARVDHSRDRQKNAPRRARALLRTWKFQKGSSGQTLGFWLTAFATGRRTAMRRIYLPLFL